MTYTPALQKLGAEPFGYQLRRARMSSGIELREAAERISALMLTTHTSLNRLEKLPAPPRDRHRRAVAYLAMVCYGYDPADLGLTLADLPTALVDPAQSDGSEVDHSVFAGLSSYRVLAAVG